MSTIIAKIRDLVKSHREDIWRLLILLGCSWSAFNLGVIATRYGAIPAQEQALFRISPEQSKTPSPSAQQGSQKPNIDHSDRRVVASKLSSSKKYHFTWCSGASTIKESNRVWYPSPEIAEAAGFTRAGNCSE